MTILFQGTTPIQAGLHESGLFAVPGNIKQPGVALNLKVSFGAEQFPNGTTTITLFLSMDNGATFRSAVMTVVMPATFIGPAPHFWNMGFGLGVDENPTHAKFSTDAPSAFSTTVKFEAV